MTTTEPFSGFTIRQDKDGIYTVYQRLTTGDHDVVGTAGSYEDAREIASSLHLLLMDAWDAS